MTDDQKSENITMSALAAHIRAVFDSNRNARAAITERLRRNKYDIDAVYSPDAVAAIEKIGGSRKYYRLTKTKCRAAKAWLKKILLSSDRPWAIDPTPVPDLPENIVSEIQRASIIEFQALSVAGMTPDDVYDFASDMRQLYLEYSDDRARKAAERMAKQIEDILADGGFNAAFDQFIQDLVSQPLGCIRAVRRMDTKRVVIKDDATQQFKVEEKTDPKLFFERINPIQVFPSPGVVNLSDGNLIVLDLKPLSEIVKLADSPGYNVTEITRLVSERMERFGHEQNIDALDAYPEAKFYSSELYKPVDQIVCIEFFGPVAGKHLIEWGAQVPGIENEIEPGMIYEIHAILADSSVIFCEAYPHGKRDRLIYAASYVRNIDSVWGDGIADLLSDSQQSMNAIARALADNLALSSRPCAAVNIDALELGNERNVKITPGNVYYVTNTGYVNGKPIEFFNVPSQQESLVAALREELNQAERISGVPEYAQGLTQGAMSGAAGTATGLAQLMDAAGNQIRDPLSNIDEGVIKPLIEDLYYLCMEDPEIRQECKGDFRVSPRGACGLAVKEQQQQRRKEFLAMVLGNQVLLGLIKPEGITRLVREIVSNLDLPVNQIIPSDSEQEAAKAAAEQERRQQNMQLVQTLIQIDQQIAQGAIAPEQAEQYRKQIYMQLSGAGDENQNQ